MISTQKFNWQDLSKMTTRCMYSNHNNDCNHNSKANAVV